VERVTVSFVSTCEIMLYSGPKCRSVQLGTSFVLDATSRRAPEHFQITTGLIFSFVRSN